MRTHKGSAAARPAAARKLRSAGALYKNTTFQFVRAFPVFVEARLSPVSRERGRRGRVLALQHKLETLWGIHGVSSISRDALAAPVEFMRCHARKTCKARTPPPIVRQCQAASADHPNNRSRLTEPCPANGPPHWPYSKIRHPVSRAGHL